MAYRYINPGHGNLFDHVSKTTYNSSNSNTFTRTGICFSNCGSRYTPDFESGTKEVWIKFDAYTNPNVANNAGFHVKNASTYVAMDFPSRMSNVLFFRGSSQIGSVPISTLLKEFWVHIKSDKTNGIFEAYEHETQIFTYSGNILDGTDLVNVMFYSSNELKYLSNIIVADEEIGKKEEIYKLPVTFSATMTDNGDGTFTATAAGQEVTQTIDTASISQDYSLQSQISGAVLVCRPATKDAEGISKLEVLENGTSTAEEEIPDSGLSVIHGIATKQTLESFATKTYGWRAKA